MAIGFRYIFLYTLNWFQVPSQHPGGRTIGFPYNALNVVEMVEYLKQSQCHPLLAASKSGSKVF